VIYRFVILANICYFSGPYETLKVKNLTLCLVLALLLISAALTAQSPTVSNAFLDLSTWNFKEQGHVALNGQWEFYNRELLSPESFEVKKPVQHEFIEFPALWNNLNKTRIPGFGYATYHVKIALNKSRGPLAVEIPDVYSSYNFWINGVLISRNGKVGRNENESMPQYLPRTIPIEISRDTLDIVLQISNFHHAKGGMREQIVIGDKDEMLFKRSVAVNTNVVMFCILIVIAIFFVMLYIFSKRQSSLLYFCALCLSWGIRSVFSNQYLAISIWPDFSWEIAAKIEYICLFLVMIWAMLFIGSLFRKDSNAIFKYLFCFCNAVFIGLTIAFKAATYTQFLPVYLSFCAVLLLYILYVIIRALISERAGAILMVICTFLAVSVFSYELVSYQGFAIYNPIITGTGYMMMFLLMAAALMYHLGFLKRSSKTGNMLTYEDLYGSGKTNN
jgi:hypothetical protein